MPFTHCEPSRSVCEPTWKQLFPLCRGVAEANLRRCFSYCAGIESLKAMQRRNICGANRMRTKHSDAKIRLTENCNGKRINAAAISDAFAGA